MNELKVKIIRGISQAIWLESKAQARLEDMPLPAWIEQAIKAYLGSEQTRRKRLPNMTTCQLCGDQIYKQPNKGQKRLIVHHDEWKNRNPSVVMLLCDKCHRARHKEIGWGCPHFRTWAHRYGTFKCRVCKKRHHMVNLGAEYKRKKSSLANGGWSMKIVRVCQECCDKLKAEGKELPQR